MTSLVFTCAQAMWNIDACARTVLTILTLLFINQYVMEPKYQPYVTKGLNVDVQACWKT